MIEYVVPSEHLLSILEVGLGEEKSRARVARIAPPTWIAGGLYIYVHVFCRSCCYESLVLNANASDVIFHRIDYYSIQTPFPF